MSNSHWAAAPRSRGLLGATGLLVVVIAATAGLVLAYPTAAGAATPAHAVAAGAAAADRATFGLAPASATGPDGRPDLDYAVSPGEVLFDHVAALNYSDQSLTLKLYAVDADETTQGGFGLTLPGTQQTGVGSWVSVPPQDATVVVAARSPVGPGTVVVPITVHVPANATPGDHAGGVLVSLSTTGRNRSGEAITLLQRTGTRVLMTVAGTLAPRLVVTDLQVSYAGSLDPVGRGAVHLSYVLRNSGNVDLTVAQGASVSGLLGVSAHTKISGVTFLLPGASVTRTAEVRGVWPQFLSHATVTGTPRVQTSEKSVIFAPVTATATVWTIPWVLIIIVVVLIVGLVLFRRHRRSHPHQAPAHSARRAKRAGAPTQPAKQGIPA